MDFERGGTESAVLSGAVRGEQDGFEQRASITRLVLLVASDEASFSTGSEFIAAGAYVLCPCGIQPRVTDL